MNSENSIISDKAITEDVMQFKVKKLGPLSWILVFIIAIVPIILVLQYFKFALVTIIVFFIVAALISPIVWKALGKKLLNAIFIESFKQWKEGKSVKNPILKLVNYLIGMDVSKDNDYYLEASVANINLNSIITILKDRIFTVTSACIGISATIATILRFIFPRPQDIMPIIGFTMIFLLISPIILFWLIPMIWSVQDANIRCINKSDQKISDVSHKIETSTIRKIIGYYGIALAFSFFLDSGIAGTDTTNLIQKYASAGFLTVLILFLNIGVSLLAGIFYLNLYHEKLVKQFRLDLAKVLNVGVTAIRKVSDQELALFNPK